MKLYKSAGKVYAALDETIELCDYDNADTLQKYKEKLLEKVADAFERTAAEAVISNDRSVTEKMENVINTAENVTENSETVGETQESVGEIPEIVGESEKPKGKKKNTIDTGKIIALKNAGRSNKWIAEDMHISPQAVANAVYKYKKKMELME